MHYKIEWCAESGRSCLHEKNIPSEKHSSRPIDPL